MTMKRAATAAAVLTLPLAAPVSATTHPAGQPGAAAGGVPLREAVAALPVAAEQREGYDRGLFRHWIDEDGDSCSTRAEVLLEQAVVAPEQGDRCRLTGSRWYSYFDDRYVDGSRGLDIDLGAPR
ncbi:hypothetical protein [Streptomyces sp. WMMC1477]|uniref:hypothetical protein n=1 Tax=Streptomyces sp. WMMC1477 TaxID=3015155 RepID=UPI0022B6305B|nr:hypothetical protein [Streptomyces sp. WMMC1477]MCZ7430157.1 hypothetical protein [Streptomyces sp. WMMC1477]MCZ7430170.1 hypothetical protein [Streptomyces sp. WMMC1477]